MKIIQVSSLDKHGKVTIPQEIRKEWGVMGKNGKVVWYKNGDKIVIDVIGED